jgi:hypothetical protein
MQQPQLAICELIHPNIHGTSLNWGGHFLVTWLITLQEFETGEYTTLLDMINYKHFEEEEGYPAHPTIRSYWEQVLAKRYHDLQIIKSEYLSTGECVAILKTCWLRIFQRHWKNILRDRKKAREKASKFLYYRERNGAWPSKLISGDA